jgi:hypothetical protein
MGGRGLNCRTIDTVLNYGRVVHVRGAAIHVIGKKEVQRLSRQGVDVGDCEGVQVVCTPDCETVRLLAPRGTPPEIWASTWRSELPGTVAAKPPRADWWARRYSSSRGSRITAPDTTVDGAATAPPPPNVIEPASLAAVPSAAEAVHEVDSMTSSSASAAAALASLELPATAAAEAVPAPLSLAPTTPGVSADGVVLPGAQWVLALRRWCNLRPSSEFRCYGLEGGRRLLAVCQRDRFSHYPFLEAERPRLLSLLAAFAERHLGETVGAAEGRPALALPRRLVWDAYVDLDSRVHLIDVAPFHKATDPLLFDWAELGTLAEAAEDAGVDVALEPELRLADQQGAGPWFDGYVFAALFRSRHDLHFSSRRRWQRRFPSSRQGSYRAAEAVAYPSPH